jgi:ribosome-binding factor A
MEESDIRLQRVASLIKHQVGEILEEEICDPRIALTTLTRVKISKDLRQATVLVSIYGDETVRQQTISALEEVRAKVAALLGERVELRYTPRICFRRDKGSERSYRVMDLIDSLKQTRTDD